MKMERPSKIEIPVCQPNAAPALIQKDATRIVHRKRILPLHRAADVLHGGDDLPAQQDHDDEPAERQPTYGEDGLPVGA